MSLTLSTHQPPSLSTSSSRSGGILLNANCQGCSSTTSTTSRRHQHTSPSPHHHSRSVSPSSSTTSSSEDSSSKEKSPKGRTISFAPLPNPRANDIASSPIDHNGVPIIVLHEDVDSRIDALPSLSGDDSAIEPSPSAYSPRLSSSNNKKSSSWSTKKLLRPFYNPKSSKSNNDSSDRDPPSSGALGLFRPSSRDSTASSQGTLTDSHNASTSAPLRRRMSTGSSPYALGPTNHVVGGADAHLALHPTLSENGGGVKMLNGRVYGGSRLKNAYGRPAATTTTPHVEPEFVEWGYGGMGSNSAHTASSKYAKLQSGQKNVVAHADEDEDDGSGMGWVRKRREAREREKKEREEREKAEQQPEANEEHDVAEAASSSVDTLPDPLASSASPPTITITPEHVTQAVTVPIRSSPHHHHVPKLQDSRLSSRTNSMESKASTITPVPGPPAPSTLRTQTNAQDLEDSTESSSDEEDESEENTTEKDDDEDEDEDVDEPSRITSACAGVEKISRHKE